MRRTLLPWLVAFVLALAAGGAVVAVLEVTAFGPGAFVRIYLDAVARGDADGALSLPGVVAPRGAADTLLTEDALAGLDDIRQVSDVELPGGAHRVTVAWSSPHGSGTSAFEVAPVGRRVLLFTEWGFRVSPVATVSLAVEHDERFFVNGLSTSSAEASSEPSDYAVLVPGSYVFGHDTAYLAAEADTVLAAEPASTLEAVVDVQANGVFAAKLDDEVRADLDACTTQVVLFPTGCPFGQTISDRITGDPVWSIAAYPELAITPGEQFGTWQVATTPATAHLVVDVQSLFDGSVSTFDRDVPFEVSYLITIDGTRLAVQTRY